MWWDLGFKIFNFAVLVFLLYWFGKKPLVSLLKRRQESIKTAIEEAEMARKKGEQKYREYKKKLQKLDQEIEQIRQTLIKEGEREKERIIKEAKEMAEKIKGQAQLTAQQELKMAQLRVKEKMAAMTVQLAEDLLKKHLTSKDHEHLVDEYIERVRSLQ
jgi:F-type H+-transporting ATPase subunit b